MALVRYWAGAKALARTAEDGIDAPTLSGVLAEIRRRHGAPMAQLMDVSVVLVDGVRVAACDDRPVTPETTVEILPPYAGG